MFLVRRYFGLPDDICNLDSVAIIGVTTSFATEKKPLFTNAEFYFNYSGSPALRIAPYTCSLNALSFPGDRFSQ